MLEELCVQRAINHQLRIEERFCGDGCTNGYDFSINTLIGGLLMQRVLVLGPVRLEATVGKELAEFPLDEGAISLSAAEQHYRVASMTPEARSPGTRQRRENREKGLR